MLGFLFVCRGEEGGVLNFEHLLCPRHCCKCFTNTFFLRFEGEREIESSSAGGVEGEGDSEADSPAERGA